MNETLKTIYSLRSIHGNFSKKEILDNDLKLILEACLRTANSSARQCYSIIVINDRQEMSNLFGYQGSKALVFCVDYTRLLETAKYLNLEYGEADNIVEFITGTIDTILAVQTVVITAKSLGIDSLITNGLHRNNLEKVYKHLELPKTACFPLITVVLGYPEEEPKFQKGRLSQEYLVHYGKYQHLTQNMIRKIVEDYDNPDKHLGLESTEKWKTKGFHHYLDWFYTVWSEKPKKKRIPEGKILEFQELLKQVGFWW